MKGGAADADGRLVQGDQILCVNGHDLTESSQEQAAPVLKMAQGKLVMQVQGSKSATGNTNNSSSSNNMVMEPRRKGVGQEGMYLVL